MLTECYAVHPATWFKVEFPEHRVVTFRPSALRPVGDDGKPIQSLVHLGHTPLKTGHKASSNVHNSGGGSGGKEKSGGIYIFSCVDNRVAPHNVIVFFMHKYRVDRWIKRSWPKS